MLHNHDTYFIIKTRVGLGQQTTRKVSTDITIHRRGHSNEMFNLNYTANNNSQQRTSQTEVDPNCGFMFQFTPFPLFTGIALHFQLKSPAGFLSADKNILPSTPYMYIKYLIIKCQPPDDDDSEVKPQICSILRTIKSEYFVEGVSAQEHNSDDIISSSSS